MNNILLILGTNRSYLLKQIWMLSVQYQNTQVHCLDLQEEILPLPFSQTEILRIYRYFAYMNGAYADSELKIPFLPQFHLREQLETLLQENTFQSLWITPTELDIQEVEQEKQINVTISEVAQSCLETTERYQLSLQEDSFLALFAQASPELPLFNWFDMIKKCALFWVTLPESEWVSAWHGEPGRLYRVLQDMELWHDGLMDQITEIRTELLEPLINAHNHWGCRLALLLFKRIYQTPVSSHNLFEQVLDFYVGKNGKHLMLLPPPKQFKVTFVILTYNRKNMLQRAVNSVLQQTCSSWDLIILDHGSTDDTPEYCRQLAAENSNIRIIRKEINLGPQQAGLLFQEMIDLAQTELICYTSDDDWYALDYLEKMLNIMQRYPWLAACAGVYFTVDPQERITFQYGPYSVPILETQLELQRIGVIGSCMQGYMLRKSILKELAKFDILFPSLKYAIWDNILCVKLISSYEVGYSNTLSVCITHHEDSNWTGQRPDICLEIVSVAEQLYQDYTDLFGEKKYPSIIVEKYEIPRIIQSYFCYQLNKLLLESLDSDMFENELSRKIIYLKKFVSLKNTIIQRACASDAPLLVNLQDPYHQDKVI